MSLPLVTRFGADPLLDLEVANKRYVDSSGGGGTNTVQEIALTSNFTTTSGTLVDITGLVLTAPTRVGGVLFAHIDSLGANSAGAANRLAIENDGVDEEIMGNANIPTNDRTHTGVSAVGDLDGRVIQGRANRSSGTYTIHGTGNSNTTMRMIESGGA